MVTLQIVYCILDEEALYLLRKEGTEPSFVN